VIDCILEDIAHVLVSQSIKQQNPWSLPDARYTCRFLFCTVDKLHIVLSFDPVAVCRLSIKNTHNIGSEWSVTILYNFFKT
jgi:hypothetical protein